MYTRSDIARTIDLAVLKPPVKQEHILEAINLGIKERVASVCVPSSWAHYTHFMLRRSPVKTCCVVGFPFGYGAGKVAEAEQAVEEGADEIDMVINYSCLLSNRATTVFNEIRDTVNIVHNHTSKLKVILETCYLDEEYLRLACDICRNLEVDFLKTSTGFGNLAETWETKLKCIKIMLEYGIPVKVSGGVNYLELATELLDMGCSRLGASYIGWLPNE